MKIGKKIKRKDKVKKDFGTQDLVKILEGEIVSLRNRIKSGRIRDVNREELRIKNLRTLGYLCKIHQELSEAQKIEVVQKEMEELRHMVAANGGGSHE